VCAEDRSYHLQPYFDLLPGAGDPLARVAAREAVGLGMSIVQENGPEPLSPRRPQDASEALLAHRAGLRRSAMVVMLRLVGQIRVMYVAVHGVGDLGGLLHVGVYS